VEALATLREIGARPEVARCLAGLGRVAMDLGATEQARRHLTRSLRLSHATGARISVARGLEAFAALAGQERRPELAVQLAGGGRRAAGDGGLAAGRASCARTTMAAPWTHAGTAVMSRASSEPSHSPPSPNMPHQKRS
jgi:hypothetical protein